MAARKIKAKYTDPVRFPKVVSVYEGQVKKNYHATLMRMDKELGVRMLEMKKI